MKYLKFLSFSLAVLGFLSLPKLAYAWLQTYEVSSGITYGFFYGLWHGFIAPFAFIANLFDNDIVLYSSVNNGFLYNFGFIVGIAIIFGILGGGKNKIR